MENTPHPQHCTFCDLIRGAAEVSICHEDADSIAFMDIQPVNNGHVLVVPRQHYESLLDVPPDLGLHLFRVTMRLAKAVKDVSGCDGLNIVVNSGAAAGQDEPHYHVHIIPRRENDGFDIPLPFNGSQMPDRTVLDAYAARIISALRDPARVDSGGRGVAKAREAPEMPSAPADRSTISAERPVDLPVFSDTGARPAHAPDESPRESGVHRRVTRPRAHGRWRVEEGAHGELVYEASDGGSDAS